MKTAIESRGLCYRYGSVEAAKGVNLIVPEGVVYALLGPNGAGKTTVLKLLMNLLEPTSGSASVMGTDSRRLSAPDLRRVGYVSEGQELPGWMTVRDFVAFCRRLYPTWDDSLCARMSDLFKLPEDRKLSALSRGMRMKVALLSSLAYHPRLLVLDEPFTGLDASVREDLMAGILELTEQEAWSVLISSHDIAEVERLADWVGFLEEGSLRLSEPMEALLGRFKRLECLCDAARPCKPLPGSWLGAESSDRTFTVVESWYVPGESERMLESVLPGSREIAARDLTLREIFVALARSPVRKP